MNPKIKNKLKILIKKSLIKAQKNTFITPILCSVMADIENLLNECETCTYTDGSASEAGYNEKS